MEVSTKQRKIEDAAACLKSQLEYLPKLGMTPKYYFRDQILMWDGNHAWVQDKDEWQLVSTDAETVAKWFIDLVWDLAAPMEQSSFEKLMNAYK